MMNKWIIYSCPTCNGLNFALPSFDAIPFPCCPYCGEDENIVQTGECVKGDAEWDGDKS